MHHRIMLGRDRRTNSGKLLEFLENAE